MTKTITTIGLCMGLGCTPPIKSAVGPDAPTQPDHGDTGHVDTGLQCDEPIQVFFDADGDGYGDDALTTAACEIPAGHVVTGGDCDDLDAGISPGTEERCDGLDQDCDGEVDEGAEMTAWFEDNDGDGHGDPERQTLSCGALEGHVDNGDDCNDEDPQVYPGSAEALSKTDTDCNSIIDDLTTDHADAQLSSGAPLDDFGFTVSGDQDIDDDGTTDLVIGSLASGEVHVYGGEALLSGADPMVVLNGSHDGDQFGRAVSLLEDINSDGHVDLVVGSPGANPELGDVASVSLYLGPLGALEDGAYPDHVVPPVPGDELGGVVADVGQVYETGSVFGVQATIKSTDALGVQLYRLSDRDVLDSVVDVSGSGSGDRFGEAIGTRFDANGDGLADLIVGAPGAGSTDAPPGAVYVFLNPIETVMVAEDADLQLLGDADFAEFGSALDTSSDLDGDGIQDVVVGAPGADDGAGKAQVFGLGLMMGEVSAEALAWATYSGASGRLGHAVKVPGDVDADGHHDLILGAPDAGDGETHVGASYIYWGSMGPGTFAPDASIESVDSWLGVGTSLGATSTSTTGSVDALLVGGYGGDVSDIGEPEDEAGVLWVFRFAD